MSDNYNRSSPISAIEDVTLGHPEYAPDSSEEDGPPHPASVWVRRVTPAMRVVWEQHSPESAPYDGVLYLPDIGVEPPSFGAGARAFKAEETILGPSMREIGWQFAKAIVDAVRSQTTQLPSVEVGKLGPTESANKLFITVKEYAKRRSLSLRTVENLIREGLPLEGHGKHRRVPVERADAWFRDRTSTSVLDKARAAAAKAVAAGRRQP
jgi:hypothetical protein